MRTKCARVVQQCGVMALIMMSGLAIGVNQTAPVSGSTEVVNARTVDGQSGTESTINLGSRDGRIEAPASTLPKVGQHQMWDEPNPLDLSGVCEPATNDPAAKDSHHAQNNKQLTGSQQAIIERRTLPQTKKSRVKAVEKHVVSPDTRARSVPQSQSTIQRRAVKVTAAQQRPRVEPVYVSADAKSLPQTGTDTDWGMTTIGIVVAALLGLMGIRRRVVVTSQR